MEYVPPIIEAEIPGNTPSLVPDTTISPYYFVGLLNLVFDNPGKSKKSYYGTGTLITAGDDNKTQYVLTCAHNLYDKRDGGPVTSVTFQRGYSDPEKPYPTVAADEWFYPAGYPDVAIPRDANLEQLGDALIEANISLDYGLVKLSETIQVDNLPHMVVASTVELTNLDAQINGYGYYKEKMSHAEGKITKAGPDYLLYAISTKKGASGSAVMKMDNQEIAGIHTRSYDEKANKGVRITDTVKAEIVGWMGL